MSAIDHSPSETMPKGMCTVAWCRYVGMFDPSCDDRGKRLRSVEGMTRRHHRHKDMGTGDTWTPVLQIVQQTLADTLGQRQQASLAAFQRPKQDAIIAPVDVFKQQSAHLSTPDAVGMKQLKYGIIPLPNRAATVYCGENLFGLFVCDATRCIG